MNVRRWALPTLLVFAGLGFWLLLAGPRDLLGMDTGAAGFALLVLVAWGAMAGVSALPRAEAEVEVSPGEWNAWIGTAFMAVAIGYFVAKLHVFQTTALLDSAEARNVGRNLVLLLVAWAILSATVGARWKDRVLQDERDHQIARQAANWGRGALTVGLISLALLLGFSPADRLQWATHPMIANLLVLALMIGCLFEYAVTAIQHRLDRR